MKQIHGGDVYRHKNVIDFSSNTNPFGAPKGVMEAVSNCVKDIEHYPDVFCQELTEALSEYENIERDKIICGNGAADLIFNVVRAVRPKKALVQTPTFVEYGQALESVGCEIISYDTKREQDFQLEEDICDCITEDLDMMFLCNPNNPTGILIDQELLEKICQRCEEKQVQLILDECFLDFIENAEQHSKIADLNRFPHLFILKAFTKRYAMAGLRLGYGLCSNQNLLDAMHRISQPWNVSIPAQAAGVAALKEKEYVKNSLEVIWKERDKLKEGLKKLGFQVLDSQANYIFFSENSLSEENLSEGNRVEKKQVEKDLPEKQPGGELVEKCLEHGILIRDCSNYVGLKRGDYRIAVRLPEENEKLLRVLGEANNK